MNNIKLWTGGVWMIIAAATACSSTGESGDPITLETATHLAALEVNDDSADLELAQPMREEGILLRACDLDSITEHLLGRFDGDGDRALNRDERWAMDEDLEGPQGLGSGRGKGNQASQGQHGAQEGKGAQGAQGKHGGQGAQGKHGGQGAQGKHGGQGAQGKHGGQGAGMARRTGLLLMAYDADQSGDLDDDETALLEADLQVRCENRQAQLLEDFDADGDGELSDDEWDAAHEAIRARRDEHRAAIVEQFDTDGDGKLSREERRAAGGSLGQMRGLSRASLQAEFDVDGNGELDAADLASLRDALRARVRGEDLSTVSDEQQSDADATAEN